MSSSGSAGAFTVTLTCRCWSTGCPTRRPRAGARGWPRRSIQKRHPGSGVRARADRGGLPAAGVSAEPRRGPGVSDTGLLHAVAYMGHRPAQPKAALLAALVPPKGDFPTSSPRTPAAEGFAATPKPCRAPQQQAFKRTSPTATPARAPTPNCTGRPPGTGKASTRSATPHPGTTAASRSRYGRRSNGRVCTDREVRAHTTWPPLAWTDCRPTCRRASAGRRRRCTRTTRSTATSTSLAATSPLIALPNRRQWGVPRLFCVAALRRPHWTRVATSIRSPRPRASSRTRRLAAHLGAGRYKPIHCAHNTRS